MGKEKYDIHIRTKQLFYRGFPDSHKITSIYLGVTDSFQTDEMRRQVHLPGLFGLAKPLFGASASGLSPSCKCSATSSAEDASIYIPQVCC